MSRTNELSPIRGLLQWCLIGCLAACLLFSLTPFMDFDLDGLSDSLVTDSLIRGAAVPAVILPALIFGGLFSACLGKPGLFSFLIVPPPVPA